jgi:hypothetical protein
MDSDMHIIEPPDLWQCYIEPEFKDQAPRGTTNSVADLGMVSPDGTPWGRNSKNVQNLGQNRRRGHSFARNQERFKPYEGTSNGLVSSTDFPHGDSKFPESIGRFLQLDISEADKRQILWHNCAAYYGITG